MSFPRKRESILICSLVLLESSASTRPAGERVTFFACAKKDNQRNTPPAALSPGILPCDCARALRGSLDVRPCTFSERAHIVCALLRTDPTYPRRASGGPIGRHPAAEARLELSLPYLEVVQGCTDSWINGAVRGAEHRRRGGKSPQGRGDGSPRLRSSTGTYCLSNPAVPRSTGQSDSHDANRTTASGA
jgi:hypothetical protein